MQDNIERNKPTSCNDTCTRKRKKKASKNWFKGH